LIDRKVNDGILLYVANSSIDENSRTVELRLEDDGNTDDFVTEIFGNYVPNFRFNPDGFADRLFIKVPQSLDTNAVPIYITREMVSHIYFDDTFFYFYDNLFYPEKLITTEGAVHAITQTGFELRSGIVNIDLNEGIPIKLKIFFTKAFHGRFHLYDLTTGLKKWIVEINGNDFYFNDVYSKTIEHDSPCEIEIGWISDSVRVNVYNGAELVDFAFNGVPLDEDSDSEYACSIEAIDENYVEMAWIMALDSAHEPVQILGEQGYTDILELITSGAILLTYKSKFGVNAHTGTYLNYNLSLQRTITDAVKEYYGILSRLASIETIRVISEIITKKGMEISNIFELITYNEFQKKFVTELVTVLIESVINQFGLKSKIVGVDDVENFGVKAQKWNNLDIKLALERAIAEYEKIFMAVKGCYADDETEIISRMMTVGKFEEFETTFDLVLKAFAKTYKDITIKTEADTRTYITTTNYGVEVS
jgi:hypothetical protein